MSKQPYEELEQTLRQDLGLLEWQIRDLLPLIEQRCLEARIAELEKVCCCDIKAINEESSINVCNAEHEDRITELKAQLTNLQNKKIN